MIGTNMILIRSIDRKDHVNETSSDFTIKLPYALHGKYELQYCMLSRAFPNIIAGYNNILNINDGVGNLSVTIGEGFYTATELLSELQTAFNALSTNFVFEIVPYSYRIRIRRTAGTFTLLTGSMNDTLGYDTAPTGPYATLTASSASRLNEPNSILISISPGISPCIVTSSNQRANFILPFINDFGAYNLITRDETKQTITFDTATIALRITMASGVAGPLEHGTEWEFVLRKI